MSEPYTVLGLTHKATQAQIRRAYHSLALLHHPDKAPADSTPALRHVAEERFKEIASAWEILGDAQRRAAYDAGNCGAHFISRDSRAVFREFFGGIDLEERPQERPCSSFC